MLGAETFSAAALRVCGEVCVGLGWRPAEFWGATPDEVAALVVALRPGEREHLDQRQLAALKERFPDG